MLCAAASTSPGDDTSIACRKFSNTCVTLSSVLAMRSSCCIRTLPAAAAIRCASVNWIHEMAATAVKATINVADTAYSR